MFILILCTLIALLASFIGSISGIGGGIIIKPVLDLTGQLPLPSVNFMSGITVLTMAAVSLIRHFLNQAKEKQLLTLGELPDGAEAGPRINLPQVISICLGSVAGGLSGTRLFNLFLDRIENRQLFVLVQAILILLITITVMLYQYNKKRIRALKLKHFFANFICGLLLGLASAFLGIGGGPLNVAVLAFFFGMTPKIAALSSHIIIFTSQVVSLITTLVQNRVPEFDPLILLSMMAAAVIASLIGRSLAAKMDESKTSGFFTAALWLILVVNLVNVIRQWIVL
jgi:uncharacterized membrane protein YfcA